MKDTDRAAAVAERVVQEAFLSPRVVDAATLAEFAESLGDLLRRAAEQREHLRRTVAEGEGVAATLRDTTSQASEKLRPALKLIPTVEQKLAQAEEAMTRAAAAAETAERAAGQAAKAATDEGVAALEAARRAIDGAMERALQLEGRLGQLTQRAETAVDALEQECRARLETAGRHAQDVLGTVTAELDARAQQALERLTGMIEERRLAGEAALAEPLTIGGDGATEAVEPPDLVGPALREAAEQVRADMESRIRAEIDARVQAQVEAQIGDQVVAQAGAAIDALRAAAAEHMQELDSRAEDSRQRTGETAASAREAEDAARGAEERLAGVRRALADIDSRGREIAAAASQALAAFDEELAERMHAVREMMEQLASVTTDAAPGPSHRHAASSPPPAGTEMKPTREPAFIRIDRPMQCEAPGGLPGHLRF